MPSATKAFVRLCGHSYSGQDNDFKCICLSPPSFTSLPCSFYTILPFQSSHLRLLVSISGALHLANRRLPCPFCSSSTEMQTLLPCFLSVLSISAPLPDKFSSSFSLSLHFFPLHSSFMCPLYFLFSSSLTYPSQSIYLDPVIPPPEVTAEVTNSCVSSRWSG